MAKLLLLIVVLSMSNHGYVIAGKMSLTKIMGIANLAGELYSGISDSVKMITQPTTEIPFANTKLEEIDKNTKAMINNTSKLGTSIKEMANKMENVDDNFQNVNDQINNINEAAKVMLDRLNLILQNLNKITEELTKIPIAVTKRMEQMLSQILKEQFIKHTLNDELRQLWEHTTRIDSWYKKFLTVTNSKYDFQQVYYDNFYYVVTTDNNNGMQAAIDYIYAMFTTRNRTSSIHDSILDFVDANHKLLKFQEKCDLQRSFQQQLQVIYNIVIVSELRVFMMTVFAYHRKQILAQADGEYVITDDYKNELRLVVEKSLTRMSGYLQAMKLVTKGSSTEIFRCDHKNPVINDHVFRLDNLFGLYYLNVKQISSDCEVEDLDIISYRGHIYSLELDSTTAFIKSYNPRYQCNGLLHKCSPGGKRIFCEAKLGSGRRYEWISMESKKQYDCNGRYIDTISQAPCADVICQCSEEGPGSKATRTFNLQPQFSDIRNNKVVTNVRLRKKDNVVHIQVQHGTLLPEGRIDENDLTWVPLGKFIEITDSDQEGFYWTDNQDYKILYEDQDYTYVTHDSTEFNLDDIFVDQDFIVTGVKFERQKLNPKIGKNLSALRLKVHGTKFDYTEGKLLTPEEDEEYTMDDGRYFKWFNSSLFDAENDINYGRGRSELLMNGKGDSLSGRDNEIDANPNQFIKFQPTAFDKDFGQTTIPYFDSRPAVIEGGSALEGVGVTHRGVKDYGGYIAPKVFSINYAKYIEVDVDIEEVAEKIVQKLYNEITTPKTPIKNDYNEDDVEY